MNALESLGRTVQADIENLIRARHGVPPALEDRPPAQVEPARPRRRTTESIDPDAPPDVPLGAPVAGVVSSTFGVRVHPITKKKKRHAGEDIAAKTGTPVHATAEGIVSHAGPAGTYGLMVEIDHGDSSYVTRFAHLSKVNVSVGERVGRGDHIGAVGSTGASTGPHLHYEVLYRNRPQNPKQFMGTKEETVNAGQDQQHSGNHSHSDAA